VLKNGDEVMSGLTKSKRVKEEKRGAILKAAQTVILPRDLMSAPYLR
jgi:hypothetical protein